MKLEMVIRDAIDRQGGIIPFSHFMELALYHPEYGYYMNPALTIGAQGDFVTAPTLHPIFAELVSRQLADCWMKMDKPGLFSIMEWGGGTGAFCSQVIRNLSKKVHARIHYIFIEKSPHLIQTQKQELDALLAVLPRVHVEWKEETALQDDVFSGVIVSNELFDAWPANRYQVRDGRFVQTGVGYEHLPGDKEPIRFTELPFGDAQIGWLQEYLPVLEEGDRVDVSIAAGACMRQMVRSLRDGYVLTFDYGDVAPDVYEKVKFAGNLRAYNRQTLSYDVYARPGRQDLTCDVNFSLLMQEAEKAGARKVGWTTQSFFLERLGFLQEVHRLQQLAMQDLQYDFELQKMLQLYLPAGLGEQVKVLALAKGDVPDRLLAFEQS